MKSKLTNLGQVLAGLAVLAFLGWGAYLVLAAIARGIAALDSDVAVAVVAGCVTVAVSVFSLALSKRLEARAAIANELRVKKIPIYEEMISTLFKVQYAEKLGEKALGQGDLMRFFVRATEQLVVWGSDDVLKEFRAFRMHFVADGDGKEGLFKYERLLVAIRKDLGHKNRGFKRGTVLGLWVNDIDRHV